MTPSQKGPVDIDRRHLVMYGASLAGAAALGMAVPALAGQKAKADFKLPPLPYPQDALEPVISKRTISFHYGKHHAGYVKKLNRFAGGSKYATMPLQQVIKESWQAKNMKVFNNAAQVMNHALYWHSLRPNGGGKPGGELLKRLQADFGGYDAFCQEFIKQAAGRFGSGWAWLVQDQGRLAIMTTSNAETPLTMGKKPLLVVDVWEHAYYLDYQNQRGRYLKEVVQKLLNWDQAAAALKA